MEGGGWSLLGRRMKHGSGLRTHIAHVGQHSSTCALPCLWLLCRVIGVGRSCWDYSLMEDLARSLMQRCNLAAITSTASLKQKYPPSRQRAAVGSQFESHVCGFLTINTDGRPRLQFDHRSVKLAVGGAPLERNEGVCDASAAPAAPVGGVGVAAPCLY